MHHLRGLCFKLDVELVRKCARKNMEKSESLFSFEFVVGSVSNLSVGCTAPAVGFRLLDYPTIMIYHTDQEVLENLRVMAKNENIKLSSSITKSVMENEEVHPNFRENDGTFLFQKGKSTLFSMKDEKLFDLLSSIPLYVVLLDMYGEKTTRIIGSCTVPLQSIVDEVKEKGVNVALFSKRAINLSLFNLMGARIGQLTGNITLYCYGNSLNKHFQRSMGFKGNGVDIFLENQDPRVNFVKSGATLERFDDVATSRILKKIDKLDKSTKIDDNLHFDSHLHNTDGDVSTQVAFSDRRGKVQKKCTKPMSNTDSIESKIISNIDIYDASMEVYCPPPLFYCSENTDPHPIARVSNQSVCSSEEDYDDDDDDDDDGGGGGGVGGSGDDKMKIIDSSFQGTDYALHNDNVTSKIPKAKDQFDVQPDSETKDQEDNYPKGIKSNNGFLQSEITDSTINVNAVLSSLNDMPLLQGLFKEIIGFTRKGYALNSKVVAKENVGVNRKLDSNPDHKKNKGNLKKSENHRRILDDDKIGGMEENGKLVNRETTRNTDKAVKKLVFKTTKSHRLRCAINSTKKDTQPEATTEIANRGTELGGVTSEPKIKEFNPPQKEHPANVNIVTRRFRSTNNHVYAGGISDVGSNNIDHSSNKSRSPVSLEVYVPSAAGSKTSPDHSKDDDVLPDDNLVSMQWSKPLEKKWSGLDDLSRLKESTDLVSHGNDEIGFVGSSSQGRMPSSKYSDTCRSASDFVSPFDEAQYASHSDNFTPHYKGSTNGSSSDRSRQSKASSKPLEEGSVRSKSQDLSRPPSPKTFDSSHSSLQSQSIRSTSRQKHSDTSKPVLSAHSPTTSRSLRTKPRNAYQSNDELTHSVDLSSDASQRTDSRKEDSLPRDDARDHLEKSSDNENRLYDHSSDDFVNTNSINSQVSSVLEEHRSPTPRHIILSQAKLGYTM